MYNKVKRKVIMTKKILRYILISLALIILSGCGNGSGEGDGEASNPRLYAMEQDRERFELEDFNKERKIIRSKYLYQDSLEGQVIDFGLIEFLGDMNPFISQNPSSIKVNSMLYRPLFYINEDNSLEMDLADNVEYSENQDSFTIRLKEGILWHDDEPMTSEDLKYTYDYLSQDQETVYGDYLLIDGEPVETRVLDDLTVELSLPRRSNSFLYKLSKVKIMPKHIFEGRERESFDANEGDRLIGNSPYAYVDYIIHEYFNTEVIQLKYKEGSIYQEPEIKNIDLRVSSQGYTNRYDLLDYHMQVGYLLPNEYGVFEDELYQRHVFDQGYDVSMVFKVNRDYVSTKELRHAIKTLSPGGTGYFASRQFAYPADSLFSIFTDFYKPVENFVEGDRTEASRLLRHYQIENKSEPLSFGFLMEEGEYQERFAIDFEEFFRSNSVDFETYPLFEEEYEEWMGDPNQDAFDFALSKYNTRANPDDYRQFFEKNSIYNYSGYTNPELIDLFAKADSENDPQLAGQIYGEIQDLLMDELPISPIVNVKTLFVTDDRLGTEDAVPDPYSFFRYPERLSLIEPEPISEDQLEIYEFERDELSTENSYDRITILHEMHNAGKVRED